LYRTWFILILIKINLKIFYFKGLVECRVFLLCLEGLYEDAVLLALTISIELAKKCALELEKAIEAKTDGKYSFPEIGDNNTKTNRSISVLMEMRRRVWLEIGLLWN
jgi:hypothetical protein